MLDKVIKFFEKEYEETKKCFENGGPILLTREEYIKATKYNCLGVAFFAQEIGIEFEDVHPHYEEIVEKLNSLLDN